MTRFKNGKLGADDYLKLLIEINTKRNEEMFKKIFHMVTDIMRHRFKLNSTSGSKPRNFYKHYFQKIAVNQNIPIDHFHFPTNNNKKT